MNRRTTLAMAALAAMSLGIALPVGEAAAQAKAQAYYITDIAPADPTGWNDTYAPLVQPTFQPFGGHYIVRAGKTTTVAGDPPSRIVIIAFDSLEKAQAWLDSAAYKAILPTRAKFLGNGKYRAYIVEGVPN
jgi:uncharacterized protein (DUF1330 family)